ncbi:recombinase family protein [Candidatus Wolfebacteria bacterium]|nr:recombinase family protein [Candidatus Wolfebacteria bacterium]
MTNQTRGLAGTGAPTQVQLSTKVKYCLYARKSSEGEERQALSIDSQIKEMIGLAEKEKLEVAETKQESFFAKATGQRPIFNEMVEGIKSGKYNGILTWATDRLSRNAGDLDVLVDLMDEKRLVEIRTYGQIFTDNPNEKFLLMILGSQAKLENDNLGVNVMRGLRARIETGLWPGMAPLGYLNQKLLDKRCELIVDKKRAAAVKLIFKKAGCGWSGRKIYHWLKDDLKFTTRGDKYLTLSGIYRMLTSPFYYGMFEYPKKSGNWYRGKHVPLITEELFQKIQFQLKREETRREAGEFVFTKLITCGYCASSIIAEQKFVKRKDGTATRCVYYGCSRTKNRNCKNSYLTEEKLITEISKHLDKISLNELGVRMQIEEEAERFRKLQCVAGGKTNIAINADNIDIKSYAKHLLAEGGDSEKRKFLSNLRSVMVYNDQKLMVVEE